MSTYKRGIKAKENTACKQQPSTRQVLVNQTQTIHPTALQRAIENPRVARPETLLSLQRLYGNRAVGQVIATSGKEAALNSPTQGVTQRFPLDLTGIPLAQAPTMVEENLLVPIRQEIAAYNNLQAGNNPADLRARFDQLQVLDRRIYNYFNNQQVSDLVTDTNYGAELRNLLIQTEDERTAIIRELRSQNQSISFENLQADENLVALQNLWTSLMGQAGRIKMRGTAAEQDKLYARMASLLQTQAGRQLTQYLNAQNAGDIELLFTGTQEQQNRDPRGAAAPAGSYAYHYPDVGGNEMAKPDKLRPGGGGGTVVNSAQGYVREAMKPIGPGPTDRPNALNIGGANYQFGGGMGSFAALNPSDVLDPGRSKASNQQGREVLTPTFITMAHELGHSFKMASGSYLNDTNVTTGLNPIIGNQFTQNLWGPQGTRLEEFVNVQGIENPIRAQSGINTRDYYETPEAVELARAKQQYFDQWDVIEQRDPGEVSEYLQQAAQRCQTGMALPNWLQGAQNMADLNIRVAPIQGDLQLNAGQQLARKKAFIGQLRTNFLNQTTPQDRARIERTREYRQMNVNIDHLISNCVLGDDRIQRARAYLQTLDRNAMIAEGRRVKSREKWGKWNPRNW